MLDFSWVLAGPAATRTLADHGATVVRIERSLRADPTRGGGPFMAGLGGPDDTALWHCVAAGKHSLQIDMSTEAGRRVAADLVRWADVVYGSFTPGEANASLVQPISMPSFPPGPPARNPTTSCWRSKGRVLQPTPCGTPRNVWLILSSPTATISRRQAHPKHGAAWVEGPNVTFSRAPRRPAWAGPTLGQHNHYVLSDLLGYSEDRIAEVVIAGGLN